MLPWWEAMPGRYELELAAFDEHAVSHEVVRGPQHGEIVVRCHFASSRGELELVVAYPDAYPYLRPHIFAHSLALGRHQNPFAKNLCLIDSSTRAWRPQDTAAKHIADQLEKLLSTVDADAEARAGEEVPQGEPLSAFIPSTPGAVVFVPDEALTVPVEYERGEARMAMLVPGKARAWQPIRAVLLDVSVRPKKGKFKRLARADEMVARRGRGETIKLRWLRLDLRTDNAPDQPSPDRFLAMAKAVDSEWCEPRYEPVDGGDVSILGIVFSEEVRLDEQEDMWLFVVRERRPVMLGKFEERSYLVKGDRLSVAQLQERVPELAGLADKTVALAGVGALGAPAAVELAKAQLGSLRLLDCDVFEAGNMVRWPLGLQAAGYAKVQALGAFLSENFPVLDLTAINHQIGQPPSGGKRERQILAELLDGADLLLDLTAEIGIGHLLSRLAEERELPQVYGWGTEGGWGGGVARCVPGETGCWFCLRKRLEDHSIEPPPFDETGTVQPRGCASQTFTGAGFDLLPVVAQSVRLACQTLLRDGEAGYPDGAGDVMILSLRTKDEQLPAPKWRSYRLEVHPECPYCAS